MSKPKAESQTVTVYGFCRKHPEVRAEVAPPVKAVSQSRLVSRILAVATDGKCSQCPTIGQTLDVGWFNAEHELPDDGERPDPECA
jgi:hypothetical protein